MNHIFYQTKTKYSNTGDALINCALIRSLRNYGKLHVNCGKDIPKAFLESLGVTPEEKEVNDGELGFVLSVIRCAIGCHTKENRVFVFSGPGDMYGGGCRLVIRNFLSGLIFPIFRLFGVKIVRIGRSVGPISALMALSEKIRCSFLSHYYVRDSLSLRRCHEFGIRKAKLAPDLSWVYDIDHIKRVNHTNVVMVNLRNSIFDDVHEEFVEATLTRCEELLKAMDEILDGKIQVLVAYQIEEDAEFARIIYDRLKTIYTTEFVDHQMRLEELELYYGKVDYHISNRMHSLLVGYKYGSLPIALIDAENHVKIAATFDDCDLFELVIGIYDAVDTKRIRTLMQNREAEMLKLFTCERKQERQLSAVLRIIFDETDNRC